MAIKFEKITAGMTLVDIHRHKMGNTTMSEWGKWTVEIVSVDPVGRAALVRWNGNTQERWTAHDLERLYRPDRLPKAYREQEERRRARGSRWGARRTGHT